MAAGDQSFSALRRLAAALRRRWIGWIAIAMAVLFVLLGYAFFGPGPSTAPPAAASIPSSAARAELPSRGPVPPISTVSVCSTGAAVNPQHGFLWPPQPLWRALLPRAAFAGDLGGAKESGASGEVHLVTLSGYRYDFQAVGEFVALKTTGVEVQLRLRPYGTSKTLSVSTAVAIKVDADVVAVYGGSGAAAYVNHRPVMLTEQSIHLPSGGQVQHQGNGVVARWPNRAELRVIVGNYLDTIMTLCASGQPQTQGLLADQDPQHEAGLLARGGGAVQFSRLSGDDRYNGLYHVFGDSWRINQAASLFDYANGETTETFTDRNFPYAPDPMATVAADRRQNAETTCREAGISEPAELADCIMDVSVTGDTAFAANDAQFDAIMAGSRNVESGLGNWRCEGPRGEAGWTCRVEKLAGAQVGSLMTFSIETRQSGQKSTEALACGPVTKELTAPCTGKTQGLQFQGGRALEHFTLKSGEVWEIESREKCDGNVAADQPC